MSDNKRKLGTVTIRNASVDSCTNSTLIEVTGNSVDADGLSMKNSTNSRVLVVKSAESPSNAESKTGPNPHTDKGRWIGIAVMVLPAVAAGGILKGLGWV